MLEDLIFCEIKGVEYIYIKKEVIGEKIMVLFLSLEKVVISMIFLVSMYWGSNDLCYICLIKWFIVMFGEEIILFEIIGVLISNIFCGYCFLGKIVIIN